MSDSKKILFHQRCIDLLDERIAVLEQTIKEAQEAASGDAKSSAGDKFETTREMLKQEMDKNSDQLSKSTQMLNHLKQIDPTFKQNRVSYGSLVNTNEGTYYFSVSLGKVQMDDQPHFALSMVSPIGKALLNKKKGEVVMFMGRKIKIASIL